jgi:hypothetical protein
MRFKVQLVVYAEDGQEDTVHEMTVLDKACQRIEHLGLTLAEAKQLFTTLQYHLVEQQASTFVEAHAQCADCGKALGLKGHDTCTLRTLFSTITLTSPRLYLLWFNENGHLDKGDRRGKGGVPPWQRNDATMAMNSSERQSGW